MKEHLNSEVGLRVVHLVLLINNRKGHAHERRYFLEDAPMIYDTDNISDKYCDSMTHNEISRVIGISVLVLCQFTISLLLYVVSLLSPGAISMT